ncbi:MAG: hypothetical protein Ct9H300mP28_06230 [Pseudomonadota bacterium]|nr:MAG: hypothetical protein Ct9H300mP28_06230 [Pseudomonadota bacterium]
MLKRIELSKGKYWSSLDEILNSVDATSGTGNTDALRELLRKHVLGEPQVLQDDEYGKIWFQQDFRFETPKAHLTFRINTPQVYSSPRNAVLSQLYTDAISEGLNEFGYPVRLAGLEYGINVDKKGIILTFSGYSDRILKLIKKVPGRLKGITIDKKTFNTLKEVRARRYQNFHFQHHFSRHFITGACCWKGEFFPSWIMKRRLKKISLNE